MKILIGGIGVYYSGCNTKVIEELERLHKDLSPLSGFDDDEINKWGNFIVDDCSKTGDYSIENDSIGAYEFWGSIGVDNQSDYYMVDAGVTIPYVTIPFISLIISLVGEFPDNIYDFLTEDLPTTDSENEEWSITIKDSSNEKLELSINLNYTCTEEGE